MAIEYRFRGIIISERIIRTEMYMGTSGGQIDHCLADACNRDWYKDRKDYSDPHRDLDHWDEFE